MEEPAEAIMITISQKMLKEKGYRNWLRNFQRTMALYEDGFTYWMRVGARPRADKGINFVYLCIGGKVRFRAFYAGSEKGGTQELYNEKDELISFTGKAFVLLSGPIETPDQPVPMKGFRGFRYCQKIF